MCCSSGRQRACCAVPLVFLFVVIIFGSGVLLTIIYWNVKEAELQRKSDGIYIRALVDAVNNDPMNTWKARWNPFGIRSPKESVSFNRNATELRAINADLNKMFSSDEMKSHIKQLVDFNDSLPSHFDAREKWPLCRSIRNVPNQGGCGSCYAIAATGVASDRACIASNGKIQPFFSEQDVVSCCSVCGDCSGGDPIRVLHYWTTQGLVTGNRDGCTPYSASVQCGTPCSPANFKPAAACSRQCQSIYSRNSYEKDKNFGSLVYTIYPRTMNIDGVGNERVLLPSIIGHLNISNGNLSEIHNVIKKELFLFGPVTIAFPATEEFLHYAEGVYHPYPREDDASRIVYWHVGRVIGWGTEDDVTNWLVVNSFGQYWGDNGLFRIEADLIENWGLEFETGVV
uniref:Peptidase C1A papain C-terminal domain-containing protein n=1 Tax=Plectus sambesii TaxID=2011161 RepID=A0A914WPT7_9BILA